VTDFAGDCAYVLKSGPAQPVFFNQHQLIN